LINRPEFSIGAVSRIGRFEINWAPNSYLPWQKTGESILNSVVYILDRFANTNSLYNTWIDDCPLSVKIVETPIEDWEPPQDAGLILTHEHFRWETVTTLRRVLDASRIPVLIMCDGILEYRNTWENPKVADGSVYQTIFGNKIACIGRGQARVIESFGNAGICEIIGHPRFDLSYEKECLPVQAEGPFRLLITTARTPAFNEYQHQQLIRGLSDLKQRFDRNQSVANRHVQVDWRLSDELLKELELPLPKASYRMPSLSDAIETADAIITTPSTVYLESVIKRRPTAILDYTNSPAYIATAWQITATAHINPTLEELANPPVAKMLFQRTTLHDQVELGYNSKQRLFKLMQKMVSAGERARKSDKDIKLPHRIIADPLRGIAKVDNEFDLASLFPKSNAFGQTNIIRLQQELAHAVARIGQLPKDIHERDDQLVKKTEHIDSLTELLSESESRIESANQRVEKLTRRHEIDSETLGKRSEHIDRLKTLLEEAHEQLREVRAKFRQRADAMLAAANQLAKEVKISGLEPAKDSSDAKLRDDAEKMTQPSDSEMSSEPKRGSVSNASKASNAPSSPDDLSDSNVSSSKPKSNDSPRIPNQPQQP
jgi:peptidoglycan hydrolase CwlO-like protein